MIFAKSISKKELGELRAINKLIRQEEYKLHVVAENTVRVPEGLKWCKTQQAIVSLLKESQERLVQRVAQAAGFEIGTSISLDLESGTIKPRPKTEQTNETSDAKS